MTTQLEQAWEIAKQRYAAVGVDVEEALRQLDRLPVSMHCWQGDDVAGFESLITSSRAFSSRWRGAERSTVISFMPSGTQILITDGVPSCSPT